MKRAAAIRLSWFTLATSLAAPACGVQPDTSSPEGDISAKAIGTEGRIVGRGPGFTVAWTEIGRPWLARKIAACGTNMLWALNQDGSLWYNQSGGIDSGWTWEANAPAAASIACDGQFLFALNADKSFYWTSATPPVAWAGLTSPWQAAFIAGGPDALLAYNYNTSAPNSNGDLYFNAHQNFFSSAPAVTWDVETYVAYTPSQRFTGAGSQPYTPAQRGDVSGDIVNEFPGTIFAVSSTSELSYNFGILHASGVTPPSSGFLNLPVQPPSALIELTASDSSHLYGLDSNYDLWEGTLSETNCSDEIDNDNNGVADEYDYACMTSAASTYCASVPAGEYCIERLFPTYDSSSSAQPAMVKCLGGTAGGQVTIWNSEGGYKCQEAPTANGTDVMTNGS